jgi:hypothetical protein
MMAVPHMLAGAAVGKGLRRPWLAWPVAFLSHFLLDMVPHLDSHGMFGVERGGPTLPEAAMGITDFSIGVLLVTRLSWRLPERRVVMGGALLAILIDVIEHIPLLGFWFATWGGTRWLYEFHHSCQHNVSRGHYALGLGTQVVVMALALPVLLRGKRPGKPTVAGGTTSGDRTTPSK